MAADAAGKGVSVIRRRGDHFSKGLGDDAGPHYLSTLPQYPNTAESFQNLDPTTGGRNGRDRSLSINFK